ncbi:hypothetical protein BBO99_00001354 [Phytophthora kernoviae]|uniref:Cyclic nucleotide-binding domain-containing protein n=2 Tax=Phytophthora kernoviae TaxID=325452 RepID=A0A421EYF6_9STRA|nr:hypothetical protein BBI17_001157 [Phytophthora kernoviae]RLN84432.1 hypothetical protein BBO99_00001354 [Phytophthora kernoviae]
MRGGSTPFSGQRSVSTQFMRGYALHRLEQYSQAAEDFLACSQNDPDRATALYNRGCALYKLGKHAEATQNLSKAIKLDPRNLLFIESRAHVLKGMGKFEEAIRDYTRLDTIKHLPTTALDSLPSGLNHPVMFETPTSSMEKSELRGLNPVSTSSTASMAHEAQKSSAKIWLEQFLNQNPGRTRSSADVAEAAQLARSWSFFRGMRIATIERCLREAAFWRFESDQMVVDQGKTSSSFHVVLDAVAPLVKTVTFQGSSSRELSTLYQGDTIGLEPFSATNTEGRLVTLRHRAQKQFMVRSRVGSTSVPLMSLASTRSLNGFQPSSMGSFSSVAQATRAARGALRPKELATFSCLGEVNCMLLDLDIYLIIMREHEQQLLAERLQFLRRCHAFQTCTDEMLAALVAVSGSKLIDPSKDVLKAGDVVKQLYVIKKGVCHVLKTITMPHRSHASPSRRSSSKSDDSLTSRSNDGSWVLDNGWMLTNPRLVSNAQALAGEMLRRSEEVATAVLASGQLFGELSVLQPGQQSPVTVRTQTLVELLVFEEEDLSQLRVQYLSGTMNALQESLLFHNPPQQKLAQLRLDLSHWSREKRGVLEELFPPELSSL